MIVVILCGGFGSRIREVTEDIPKPMIPIGEHPILWHIMKYFAHWGHHRYILCLGYKAQVIKDFFLNYETQTQDLTVNLGDPRTLTFHSRHSERDWEVTLINTGQDSMTGFRIQQIRKYLGNEPDFFLTYGDGVGNIDLDQLVRFHRSHGKILTVTGVRPPGRFGEIESEEGGLVTSFNEKPQAGGGRISGGFFLCRQELFRYLEDRKDLVFEQEPMRRLVNDRQLMVFEHNGFWHPMDTRRDYQYLEQLIERGEAPWMIWEG